MSPGTHNREDALSSWALRMTQLSVYIYAASISPHLHRRHLLVHLVISVQWLSRSSLAPRGVHFRHSLPCLPVHISRVQLLEYHVIYVQRSLAIFNENQLHDLQFVTSDPTLEALSLVASHCPLSIQSSSRRFPPITTFSHFAWPKGHSNRVASSVDPLTLRCPCRVCTLFFTPTTQGMKMLR